MSAEHDTSGQEFDDAQAADAASQSGPNDDASEGLTMDGDQAQGSDTFGAGLEAGNEPAEDDSSSVVAPVESAPTVNPAEQSASDVDQREDAGDADSITDDGESDSPETVTDWDRTTSAHRIAVELKRIETDVRGLLEHRDPRRKRRLTGTRRWLELQEDIVTWYGADRFDVDTLRELQRLVTRRHHLFRRLSYISSTRSGWNT